MKNTLAKIALFSVVTAALMAAPTASRAQATATEKPAASDAAKPAKKHGLPFHGKIAALDAAGATLTVGKLVLNVTADTKITKDGKPATLADLAVGEKLGGAYKKTEAGKLDATVIHAGEKAKKKTE